jgi:hypothetical protein
MYVLSMRRGHVPFSWILAVAGIGCQAATSSRPIGVTQPGPLAPKPESVPQAATRQAIAVALTNRTIARLREFGFAFDGEHLNVVLATKERFVAGLAENAAHFEMPGQFDALSAIDRLFGMLTGTDPAELKILAERAIGEATLAYYDHVSKSLVFRDDADARLMSLESLVAHELAHAYQDQAPGGIDGFIRDHRDSLDRLRAAHGVFEGQAVVIGAGVEWFGRGISLDRLDPDLADTTVGRLASGESFSVVYEAGRRFILKSYRQGGWQSVGEVLRQPPTSTEQLLHPEKFRRDLPSEVAVPKTPKQLEQFPTVFDGTVGELLIYNRLLLVAKDLNQARLAAAGWDGDRLQVRALPGGGYAAVWRILWDRVRDAQQFEAIAAQSLHGRKFVGLRRRDRVTDLVYAESKVHFEALTKAMAAPVTKFEEQPFDAESTALVEAAWERAEQQRPYVEADRWILPEYGLSFAIPSRYIAVTLRGVDLLVTLPQDGFANNVSLVYEQDLFDGDIERYMKEARHQTSLTSQKWISHQTIAVGQSRAAIVQLEVPSDRHQTSIAMLVVPRRGRWITITCAALSKQRGETLRLLAGIIQTLRFE